MNLNIKTLSLRRINNLKLSSKLGFYKYLPSYLKFKGVNINNSSILEFRCFYKLIYLEKVKIYKNSKKSLLSKIKRLFIFDENINTVITSNNLINNKNHDKAYKYNRILKIITNHYLKLIQKENKRQNFNKRGFLWKIKINILFRYGYFFSANYFSFLYFLFLRFLRKNIFIIFKRLIILVLILKLIKISIDSLIENKVIEVLLAKLIVNQAFENVISGSLIGLVQKESIKILIKDGLIKLLNNKDFINDTQKLIDKLIIDYLESKDCYEKLENIIIKDVLNSPEVYNEIINLIINICLNKEYATIEKKLENILVNIINKEAVKNHVIKSKILILIKTYTMNFIII